ncbi:MAG: ATP synthase F1 subunit delta [Tepidanaerobacteraceae bacterium]|nr:ATP synthase F1 subunit delta [Tepidanaerobacteraceae bacterium]
MGAVETYAEALFSVAKEKGRIEEILYELQDICQLMDTVKDFRLFLNHPLISVYVKKAVVKSVFSIQISQEMQNFIFFTIERNRQNSLKQILGKYSDLYRKFKNERCAKVYTVVALSDKEKAVLKDKLDTMFDTNAVIENIIDKTILGGIIIRMGFEVIDGSYRSDLEKIKTAVLQGEYI